MAQDRKSGTLEGIEPDSKSQVTMQYENGKPKKVTSVVISTQHSKELNQEKVKELILPYICLLYTSPSPRDATLSRMPSSA